MKIITFEEHIIDKDLGVASAKEVLESAPYIANLNTEGLPYAPSLDILIEMGESRIADMNRNGIDMQILSITNVPQLITSSEAIPLTKAANDKMAITVKAHPDRFGAFAALPLSDPKAAADELKRTVNELGFKGALITGRPSAKGTFLDDAQYQTVLEAANNLDVPIYVHPGFPFKAVQETYYDRLDPIVSARLSNFGWGWHAESGVQVIRMILAGVFDKFPNLKIISGHWGEMVPFFLARLDEALPREATKLPQTISEYYKEHVYVTPSGMFTLPHFKFTLDTIGVDRILYSVDYPYIGNEGAREFLENAPISQADKEKIAHGNAERLLKL